MTKRKDKVERDDLMNRTRAAVGLVNAERDEGLAMAGFMELFHPGHPKTRELIRDARNKNR
jgi:hypothetical protein